MQRRDFSWKNNDNLLSINKNMYIDLSLSLIKWAQIKESKMKAFAFQNILLYIIFLIE